MVEVGIKLAVLTLASVVLTIGCSARSKPDRLLPTGVETVRELKTYISTFNAQEVFTARYNPPGCSCPHTEIKVGKRWIRVKLEPDEPETKIVKRYLRRVETDRRGKIHRHYRLKGSLETDMFSCRRRLYLTFSLKSFARERRK